MTRSEAINMIVNIALKEVGTREGDNNWNRYAADPLVTEALGWNAQNQPWCAIFDVWLFAISFGVYACKSMLYAPSAACAAQANAFKINNAFYLNPEVGDIAFFYAGGDINHQGIVVEVFDTGFRTVEGNYSNSVCEVLHNLTGKEIAGFGRPLWEAVADEDDKPTPIPRKYATIKYGDGLNNPSNIVKAWQALLLVWGFNLGRGGADGEFGSLTLSATQKWQDKVFGKSDGIVTEADWKEIIEIPKGGSQ